MLRFRIDHPTRTDMHAEAGHDPVMGFFVDVMQGHRVIKSYDFFHPLFNRTRPLLGCLDFLVSEGFFTGDELEDALVCLQDGEPEPSDMRVVDIVMDFRRDAD
jgi:hypothetical protein